MVAEALDISRETYFAILLDRAHNGPVMVGSPEGGMDIEEVAEKNPEAIFTDPIDINTGITDSQARSMARNLKFAGSLETQAAEQIKQLYSLFCKVDATQVEINPFGETPDGKGVYSIYDIFSMGRASTYTQGFLVLLAIGFCLNYKQKR